jgi:hypothetical protein
MQTTPRQPLTRRKATSLPPVVGGDPLTATRLNHAVLELQQTGALTGARSQKLSIRVDPGLIEAARRRTGLHSDSDLINAALAVIAAGDDYGAWLVRQSGRLPEDFELAV